MKLLDESQQHQVAAAIAEVERHTDAELVAVLATRSDDYRYIPLLWATAFALAVPLPLLYFGDLSAVIIFNLQLLVFVTAALLFQLPAIRFRLIPKAVLNRRTANVARRQFLEQGLHHTRNDVGMLIFVSEAERYVEILVDRGISRFIDDAQWQQIVDEFVERVRRGESLEGFLGCIERSGILLQQHLPATGQKNELPNRFILLP
jgi:putative membrane protein